MAAKKSANKKKKQAALPKSEPMTVTEAAVEKEKPLVSAELECREIREPMTKKDAIMVVLYSVLMFVAMTVQTGKMSMVLMVLALVLSIGKKPLENLRTHLSLPMLGMIAFTVMCGCASLYSRFDGAAAELYKIMAAFSLMAILLTRFEKKHVRGLLWGLATVCAVIALICVDMGSWGKLFEAFNGYVQALGGDFSNTLENSLGGRVNGIYNDANLTGALLGMAVLLSAYLAHTAQRLSGRFLGLTLMGISAVSFLLAMSRGAMLVFAVAVLVYLAAEGGKTRGELFFLLLTAGGVSVAVGIVAMMKLGQGEILPVLLSLLAGPAAFAVDWAVTGRLARKLRGHGKLVAAICGGLVVALICAVVAAFQITEPFVFDENALHRGMALSPGAYTISGDWEKEEFIILRVQSVSREQVLLNQSDSLYYGEIDVAEFIVPEDSIWVNFSFFSTGGVLEQVVLSDGTEIPLTYTLLPETFVVRLQDGLLRSGNFQQRLQYLRDGMTIFKESSLIGHGLGSTEHLLMKVQPYHYESLFIHNHILQVMDEMGVVGLVIFLLLLLGSLWMLIRRRIKAQDSLAAVLIACWVMMNLHSLIEINFSIRMYQCAAFFVLMLPVLLYVESAPRKWSKLGSYAVLAVICLDLAVFGSLLQGHRTVQEEAARLQVTNADAFMASLQDFAERDAFEKLPHQLNYVANALTLDEPAYNDVMYQYVEDIHNTGTYAAYMGLAQYYYLPQKDWQEMFACSRMAVTQIPMNSEAWNMQVEFYRAEVLSNMGANDMGALAEGVSLLESHLARCSEGKLEEIRFTAENQTFLQRVNELAASGSSEADMYQALVALNAELNAKTN